MTEHIFVCPYNKEFLSRLKNRTVVVTTEDPGLIYQIQREVNKSNMLHAIKVSVGVLSEIRFQESWQNIPIAFYANEFGSYKNIQQQLHILRNLNSRIFLSDQSEFNFIALRILSSLRLSCGLHLTGKDCNWEMVNDLMHFTMYGRIRHAPIEPFDWIVSHYEPTGYTDFSFVYFNNPVKYLHINEKEQIALTEDDMRNNHFIAEDARSVDTIKENEEYQDFLNKRYEIMMQMTDCAFCPAFRVCLGKYKDLHDKNNKCKSFFSDLMEAADYAFSKKTHQWQL
ncbi:MAG: hypothetical protein JW894_02185 [Bacteroidales bacterium]|nr:hypothetical protein [Bacteroidales bacterium]